MDDEVYPGFWGWHSSLTPEQAAEVEQLPAADQAAVHAWVQAHRDAAHTIRSGTASLIAKITPDVEAFQRQVLAAPEGRSRDQLADAAAVMILGLESARALHDGVPVEDIWSVHRITGT